MVEIKERDMQKEKSALTCHHQKQRGKILKIAGRLFVRRGYLGTSIDDIAKTAGINKATIYYYFKSKKQILDQILIRFMEELLDLAKPIANSELPAEQKLKLLVTGHLKWLTEHYYGITGIGQLRRYLPPRFVHNFIAMRDDYEAIFREVLDEMIAKSKSSVDARLTSLFFLSMLNSTTQWYKPGGRLTYEEIAEEACKFVSRSLQSCYSSSLYFKPRVRSFSYGIDRITG